MIDHCDFIIRKEEDGFWYVAARPTKVCAVNLTKRAARRDSTYTSAPEWYQVAHSGEMFTYDVIERDGVEYQYLKYSTASLYSVRVSFQTERRAMKFLKYVVRAKAEEDADRAEMARIRAEATDWKCAHVKR